jgi:hypothetical protein
MTERHKVTVDVRHPRPNRPDDAGEVAYAVYTVEGDVVRLCEVNGESVAGKVATLLPSESPRAVASRLARQSLGTRRESFHRPLRLPPMSLA